MKAASPRVLVTGASGGLGREMARQMAKRGWRIAVTGRREDAERAYEHALVANQRMGARPWLALTQSDYGTLLLTGPAAGHARGRELIRRAEASFRELGMVAGAG